MKAGSEHFSPDQARIAGGTAVKLDAMKYMILIFLALLAGTPLPVNSTPGEVSIGEQLRDSPMQGLTGDSLLLSE